MVALVLLSSLDRIDLNLHFTFYGHVILTGFDHDFHRQDFKVEAVELVCLSLSFVLGIQLLYFKLRFEPVHDILEGLLLCFDFVLLFV